MISSNTLLEMSQVDIEKLNPATLVDIHTVVVDHSLPHENRILSVVEQMGNPYCFLSGDTPVRIRFVGGEKPLSQSLVNYFSQLKQK